MPARRDRTIAVLPVKRFGAAKQRLDNGLSEGTRRALAEAMVTDVLIALRRATRVDEVLVGPARRRPSRWPPATTPPPSSTTPTTRATAPRPQRGIQRAFERGATRVLLVPGDCPALDPGRARRAPRAPRAPRRPRSSSSPTATGAAPTRCC